MIDTILSKPYLAFARGPESFDCWGLCFHILTERGFNIPEYPIDPADKAAVIGEYASALDFGSWELQEWPDNDCVVLMGMRRYPTHCGMYHNGRILHCTEATGVIIETVAQIRARGLTIKGFYKWQK